MSSAFELMKNPIFVALDIDDKSKVLKILKETQDIVGGFKIGPRLLFRGGMDLVREVAQRAPTFLDFKFYDIPNTMEHSIRSAFEAGISFATIHTLAGHETIGLMAKLEAELSQVRPFNILGVTLLTSYSQENLPRPLNDLPLQRTINELVEESQENGIKNFVCSAHEVQGLKEFFPECNFVTPGIRLEKTNDDQKRTATPAEALKWGAKALVIGRPIVNAEDPKGVIEKILETI